jgi:hypothetical protein
MIFLAFHTNRSDDSAVLSLELPGLLDILRIPAMGIFFRSGNLAAEQTRQTGGMAAYGRPDRPLTTKRMPITGKCLFTSNPMLRRW